MNKLNLPSMKKFGPMGLCNPFVLLWASPRWKRPPDIESFYLRMEKEREFDPAMFLKDNELLIVEVVSIHEEMFYIPTCIGRVRAKTGSKEDLEQKRREVQYTAGKVVLGFDWVQAAVYERMTEVEQRMVCFGYYWYNQMMDRLMRRYIEDENIVSLKMQEWFDNNWYVYDRMLKDLVYNNVLFTQYQTAFEIFDTKNPTQGVIGFKQMIVDQGDEYEEIQFLCSAVHDVYFDLKIEDIEHIERDLLSKWVFSEIEIPSEEDELQKKMNEQVEKMLKDNKIVDKCVKYVQSIESLEDEFLEFQEMNERFRFYRRMVLSKPQHRSFSFEFEERRVLMIFEVADMKQIFSYQSRMYLEEIKQCLRMVETLGINKQCAAAFLLYVIVREKRKKKALTEQFLRDFDDYISEIESTKRVRNMCTLERLLTDDDFMYDMLYDYSEEE